MMPWNTFVQYGKIFFDGLVASFPSIIAALGIIINNKKANVRMKDERSKAFKLGIIEELYKQYDECVREYINIASSVNSNMIKIQNELIYKGTDNLVKEYRFHLIEAGKKALYLATYRNSLIKVLGIDVDVDKIAISLNDIYKKISVFTNELVMVSKLFIVIYYETTDFNKTTNDVIEILIKQSKGIGKNTDSSCEFKTNKECFENEYEKKLEKYSEVIGSLGEDEKNEINARMKFLIDKFSFYLEECTETGVLEQFGVELSEEIGKVLK